MTFPLLADIISLIDTGLHFLVILFIQKKLLVIPTPTDPITIGDSDDDEGGQNTFPCI